MDTKEKLEVIEKKIDEINDKVGNKWFIPIAVTIITAVLGTVSFLLEKNHESQVLSENSQRQVIGKFIAENQIIFYKTTTGTLLQINDEIETLIHFPNDSSASAKLDSLLEVFRPILKNQQIVDNAVVKSIEVYTKNAAEFSYKLGNKEKLEEGFIKNLSKSHSEANSKIYKWLTDLRDF